jgi:hypothetical protein
LGAGAGSRRDVRVVLSNTAPVVAGRALDERGAAVSGATVLVFPVDAARWQGWPYHRRLVRPDVDGRFVIDTLPPGECWLIATSVGSGCRQRIVQQTEGSAKSISVKGADAV